MQDLLTLDESARLAGVSSWTMRRWVKAGQVRGLVIGGRWHVLREDVVVRNAQAAASALAHTNGAVQSGPGLLAELVTDLSACEDSHEDNHDDDDDDDQESTR